MPKTLPILITDKEELSRTTYYAITGEIKQKNKIYEIFGTLTAMCDENNDSPNYEFTFLEDESEIKLTEKQIKEFENSARLYCPF